MSWSQYDAPRALGEPKPVVYLYLTDVYHNRSAVLFLAGRIAEAEYVVLFFDALLRAVQYGRVSRFAHDRERSSGRVALLRVPWMLICQ